MESSSSSAGARRVTVRDVARAAGVSPAAVSHAFRGSRHVSAATRERVLETADAMGYRPHPMVAALMGEIRRNKAVNAEAVLAMADLFTGDARLRKTTRRLILEGAAARAQALGYRLDLFEPLQEGQRLERFAKILRARGIQGIILPPIPGQPDLPAEFPWEEFCVVTAGFVCRSHAFNSVVPDHMSGMAMTLDTLSQRGYTRIGLCVSQELDRRVRHAWSARYYWHLAQTLGAPGPLLKHYAGPLTREAFLQWIAEARPDAVVCDFGQGWAWVSEAGLGAAVGVAHLIAAPGEQQCVGINQNYAAEGAAAVDLLSTQLLRNERGVPGFRMNVQISPSWIEGQSLRSV